MKMVLHILKKDLRRHWIEISGYLLVCATWAWREAHPFELEWMKRNELIPILLFGLMFLITVRLVQGECLVGDREWWPTHPYRWPQLMAAKALALLLCLNLPLLIAQLYLLHHAHLPISWSLVPGLLVLQATLIFFITFPTAVLASITASIMQWVITVVVLILAVVAFSWIPWSKLPDGLAGGEDVASWIGFGIVVPAMVLVLVWQFALRRETPARWLLGLSLLAIPLCIFLSSTSMVRRIGYPLGHGANPVQLSIVENGSGRKFRRTHSGGQSTIGIPIVDRALDSNSIVRVDGHRAEFSGTGWHWESKWKSQSVTFTQASPGFYMDVDVPEEIAKKIGQGSVSVKMEVAFNIYQLDRAQIVDTRAKEFDVPGVGRCEWADRRAPFLFSTGVPCVAPLELPAVRVFQIDAAGDACPLRDGEGPVAPGHFAYTAEFGGSDGPDPNPIRSFGLAASAWIPSIPDVLQRKQERKAYFCRGTRFTVRTGRLTERLRATFDLGDIGSEEPSAKGGGEDSEQD
jgi:hypothetical protein